MPTKLLIAVQDGMQIDDVASLLSLAFGIFIGGTTKWKETTAQAWALCSASALPLACWTGQFGPLNIRVAPLDSCGEKPLIW
jgi:hypothetical protein